MRQAVPQRAGGSIGGDLDGEWARTVGQGGIRGRHDRRRRAGGRGGDSSMTGGVEMGGGGTEEIRQAPELSWVSWLELEGRHHHLRPYCYHLHAHKLMGDLNACNASTNNADVYLNVFVQA